MPTPSEWHPGGLTEGSPVWKELVPGEKRAITLSHLSYPYVDTWASADPADLTRICTAYLEKIRETLGLPPLFDSTTGSFVVPLVWMPIDLADIPGPLASVWVKRFADPVQQTGLIDRTAIVLAAQSARPNDLATALCSRLGIKVVAHVSAEAQPPWTVRITGATCSVELAKSLGPYHSSVVAFLQDFFASPSTRGHVEGRIRIAAQLPGDAPVAIDGVRARGANVELFANASRSPQEPNDLTYRLTARLVLGGPTQVDVQVVEKVPLVIGTGPAVQANLFRRDPASESPPLGTGDIVDARPNRAPDRLERYRVPRDLPGLTLNSAGDAHLIDDLAQVEVMRSKLVDPAADETVEEVVRPAAVPHARTNGSAALSGYQHARELFDTMRGYRFSPAQYFRFAGWPLLVRHRATIRPGPGKDGTTVNAQVDYDPMGGDIWAAGELLVLKPLQVRFAMADLLRSASRREPLGLTADPRWSWHEYCHVLLVAATGTLELAFAHSAGDALAAIRSDPGSGLAGAPAGHAGLRGATFPWAYLNRRHDRSVWHGWSWSGTYHRPARFPLVVENRRRKGYQSEQILSTSLFRVYRALGGDTRLANGAPDVAARQAASDYTLYLIMRAIKSLPPAFSLLTETPAQFVSALGDADIGTLPPSGLPSPGDLLKDKVGGCAYKVVRWAFEAQGLYATTDPLEVINAPGEPPDVDVFIDNGRPDSEGAYLRGGYMPVSLDWIGPLPRWHARATAFHVTGNQVSVQVRNRGRSTAAGVTVRVWYTGWPASLPNPPRWDRNAWAVLGPSAPQPVPPGGSPVTFGPFTLPSASGRRLILAEATCTADPSNVDTASGAPCAVYPTPIVDLVAGDNNLGLRVH